ncbi:GNAT family N-acetyltransferase [Streptomyces sp. NPDC048389]|uniref:GNAT family N-acetyltransferase n=1 Tax=Streptomyces sp. NPDC048389 TaxID=3154622 RepID=UPI003456CE7E
MTDIVIRSAVADDIPAIVAMLADDSMGVDRESPDDLEPCLAAYERLRDDPHQHVMVAERAGTVVATLQLTIVHGLSRRGSTRSIIEAVRVHTSERGRGLGQRFVEWAIEESRKQGCRLVQLTSDASRADAHRFYERLGFTGSHIGFKLPLGP